MPEVRQAVHDAGMKDEAKRTALQVGVSVTPGIDNGTALTLLKKAVEQLELTMKDGVNSRPKHAPDSKTTPTMTNRDLPKGVKQA